MASIDTIFDLLSDERRRYALYYLHDRDGPVAVEELVEQVAAWEDEPPDDDVSWDEFDRIVVDLKHNHLPQADDVEFVQYRPDRDEIQVRGTPPAFDAFVTVARLLERPGAE